jgi:hypothetical protein
MPGSRNLVVFLGIGLVIVRFWTSGQRTAMSSLWSAGASNLSSSNSSTPYATTTTATNKFGGKRTTTTLNLGGQTYIGQEGGH